MKEQSHKDEMSAALRGDFDRLRERGVAVTLAPGVEPAPETTDACAVSDETPEARRGFIARLLGRPGSAA